MGRILKKTLQDLEFPSVLQQVSASCATELGKDCAMEISTIDDREALMNALGKTSEYLSSFSNENRIPNHGFDSILPELQILGIDNTVLEISGFRKISEIYVTVRVHKKFYRKFKEYYPLLHESAEMLHENPEIPDQIGRVIDRFGEIKDRASEALYRIRKEMNQVRGKINQSFNAALTRYHASEFLDEIRESVVENRRVLAVKAMCRKKVRGTVMGSSRTGSIVYIEPEASLRYSRELNNLEFEEREEIQRILKELTDTLRPYAETLAAYQDYLTETDLISAKAKYAREIKGILPDINDEGRLYLKNAFHPLLFLSNRKSKQTTWPQTITLHPENRIIVISGPNAGGKSITLKTIGLLQVMLQSGMLIPVHERSSLCLFEKVLTDIGDNQSIENHLSTYSYRLKNMNRFLKKCDSKTLFLIDEFGTGSDPELGGALAEVFLEVFYEANSFGVITTHYANLKALANELPHATNANMLFDSRTLQPTFQLEMGQPGSSFTFEVAQKNGIPYGLINRARKKVSRGKIRFDATIAKLQKERSRMAESGNRLQEEESKARDEAQKNKILNAKLKNKLESYQELYDHNQRMIYLGNKVNTVAEKYFHDNKKRALVSELIRIVETENSKRKKKSAGEAKKERDKKLKIAAELQKEVINVRKAKKAAQQKAKKLKKAVAQPQLHIGDRVRLYDGKAVGTIDSLEKGKAVVNYGVFTTNVGIDQLELVEKKS